MKNRRFGLHELCILQVLGNRAGVRKWGLKGSGCLGQGCAFIHHSLSYWKEKETLSRRKTQLKNTWNTAPCLQILLISQPILINHSAWGLPKAQRTCSTCSGGTSGTLSSAGQKCPDQGGLQETSFPWHRVSSAILCLALFFLPLLPLSFTAQNPKVVGVDGILKMLQFQPSAVGKDTFLQTGLSQALSILFFEISTHNITQSKQEERNHPLHSEFWEQKGAWFANPDAVW